MPYDLTTPEGPQTDKLQIISIDIREWDDATGPLITVRYNEFETDGTTFIRKRAVVIADRAAVKALLDASGTFPVYTQLESILHTQMVVEGAHGAGVVI